MVTSKQHRTNSESKQGHIFWHDRLYLILTAYKNYLITEF